MALQINIKNDEAHRMAHELSRLTGESMTQAVTNAIAERLHQKKMAKRSSKADVRQKLDALIEEFQSLPVLDDRHPNDILYDEHGLAKPRNEI